MAVVTKTSGLGSEVKELVALLQRCVGPEGKVHLVTSATGHTSVTSVSTRLIPTLQRTTTHPVLTVLLNSAQAQTQRFKDGGLWTCICAGFLLDAMTKYEVSVICDLCNHGLSMLDHSAVRVAVSLNSVRPLLLLAQSVLRSKFGAFGAACSNVLSVALAVVKAFIESSGVIGNLVVQTETGLGEPRVLGGLLWRATEDEVRLVRQANWRDVPVVIVTGMLADFRDPEKVETEVEIERDGERKLAAALRLVKLVIKADVRVLACQKVVDPKIQLVARRSGLLILPRLGTQRVARLEQICGAKAIGGDLADVELSLVLRNRGRLRSIDHEVVGGHDYLVLGGEHLCTLLLYAPTSEVSNELSAVSKQALAALACVVSNTKALPGAGCVEVWLCAQLWRKVTLEGVSHSTTKRSTLLSILRCVQLSLLSAAGLHTRTMNDVLSVDSQKHHAWNCSVETNGERCSRQCRCKLVAIESLDLSTQWTIIGNGDSGPPVQQWSPASLEACPRLLDQSDVILDAFSIKRNALTLAVETASTLASVGATLLPLAT